MQERAAYPSPLPALPEVRPFPGRSGGALSLGQKQAHWHLSRRVEPRFVIFSYNLQTFAAIMICDREISGIYSYV